MDGGDHVALALLELAWEMGGGKGRGIPPRASVFRWFPFGLCPQLHLLLFCATQSGGSRTVRPSGLRTCLLLLVAAEEPLVVGLLEFLRLGVLASLGDGNRLLPAVQLLRR